MSLSLLGALVFLIAGVIVQVSMQQFVYPLLSAYHERAKYMGRRTVAPSRVMLFMRIVNFLVLPLVGLLAGGSLFNR
jgi:hypothetical protein